MMFGFKSELKVFGALVILVIIDGGWGSVDAKNVFALGTLEFPFKCNEEGNLWCEGGASTSPDGALCLVPGSWAAYANPLDMLDEKRRWLSFSTYFRFVMEYGEAPGDGMTFLILSAQGTGPGSPNHQSSSIRGGVGDLTVRELAVRFKSFFHDDLGDRSSNQVGVRRRGTEDTDVIRNADELGIKLAGDTGVHVWIDFHALQTLEIRISLHQSKPQLPFISYTLNRSELFDDRSAISVGFSGSNRFNSIESWRLDTFSDSVQLPDIDFPVVFIALTSLYCLLIVICSRKDCQVSEQYPELDCPSISTSRSSSSSHVQSEAANTMASDSDSSQQEP